MPSLAYARDLSRFSKAFATDPDADCNSYGLLKSLCVAGKSATKGLQGGTNTLLTPAGPDQPITNVPGYKMPKIKIPKGYEPGTATPQFDLKFFTTPGTGPINNALCGLLPLPGCANNPKCFGLPVPCWMLAVGGVLIALVLIKH